MMRMRNEILELWRPLGQSGFQPPEACVNVSLQSNTVAAGKVPGAVASIHMGDDAAWSSCARIEARGVHCILCLRIMCVHDPS
jgi:hypothetical protein